MQIHTGYPLSLPNSNEGVGGGGDTVISIPSPMRSYFGDIWFVTHSSQ